MYSMTEDDFILHQFGDKGTIRFYTTKGVKYAMLDVPASNIRKIYRTPSFTRERAVFLWNAYSGHSYEE